MSYQDDRRRDSYVALHAWQQRTGESVGWEQLLDPEAVLAWASADPEVSRLLRHRY
ncbi:MAG: hypothetical protein MUF35_12600 [Candidatus Nanopelagicales bacterium]|jgi:hypothetical protein|nr:hypothetical protein [Candidatus Nanopelagicales bacterium]